MAKCAPGHPRQKSHPLFLSDGVATQVSGTIYVGGEGFDEYNKLLSETYGLFAWTNPLHPSVFPGVRQMEVPDRPPGLHHLPPGLPARLTGVPQAEVVRMCCGIFGGNANTCGSITSGASTRRFGAEMCGGVHMCMGHDVARGWVQAAQSPF
jgi:hypothetical protein